MAASRIPYSGLELTMHRPQKPNPSHETVPLRGNNMKGIVCSHFLTGVRDKHKTHLDLYWLTWGMLIFSIRVSPRHWFFNAGGHMIRSGYMNCCLAAQKRFLLFKGPSYFKKIKNGGNVEHLKAYTVKFHYVTLKHLFLFFKLQFSVWQLVV